MDKARALERVRASSDAVRAAKRDLWETAKLARAQGMTLDEISRATGYSIETVRRGLGEPRP